MQTGSETLTLYGAADSIPGTDSLWVMVRHANRIRVNRLTVAFYLSALEHRLWYTKHADSSKVVVANIRQATAPMTYHSVDAKQLNRSHPSLLCLAVLGHGSFNFRTPG